MNVGLALEIDSSIDSMSEVVAQLDECLQNCFRDRKYGEDVENVAIGIILTSPDVDRLHRVRDLRYKRHVRYKVPEIELINVVAYDVKPSFEIFSQLTRDQARAYLVRLLVESLAVIEKHRRKFPNFDLDGFKSDFVACLQG